MIPSKSTILAIKPPQRVCESFSEFMDDPDSLHLTVANLGDLKDELVSQAISLLHSKMKQLNSINIEYTGEGFIKLPDSKFAIVALVSGRGLDEWRYEIASCLKEAGLLNNEVDAFQPHMTIKFSDSNERILPASFGFKTFTAEAIYFMRGPDTQIPIFAEGHKED